MNHKRTARAVSALMALVLLATSVLTRHKIEAARGQQATLEEVLYIPSGKVLKRMSLGYSTLLADIYWTRAVQYFGNRLQQRAIRYDLLAPLLEITTDLDPHLIVAYQTGSIFLAQRGAGAGQPDKAVALLEKGIRENPNYWRLYFTLGFVHFLDRKDYKAAQAAFESGSKVPGALAWMKVMAARMAERRHDISTAILLWKGIYDSQPEGVARTNALQHLQSLQADASMEELERRIEAYRERTGTLPHEWTDLIREGFLGAVPLDPFGEPFKLMPDGTTQVHDPSLYTYLGEFRSEKKPDH